MGHVGCKGGTSEPKEMGMIFKEDRMQDDGGR